MRTGALVLSLLLVSPLRADTITLTNGKVIEADRTWVEGAQLYYEKSGGVFGIPRRLVQSVEAVATPSPSASPSDPEVAQGLDLGRRGRNAEAVRVLSAALRRDPRNGAALVGLAEVYLRLGDARSAAENAKKAIRLDERDARARIVHADALLALGDTHGAEQELRLAVRLKPDATAQKKLDALAPASAPRTGGAQFRLRYDGGVNEPLGVAVLQALSSAYAEYAKRLGIEPRDAVSVVLMTEAELQEAGAPGWAEGLYDGTVRIPAKGIEKLTPRVHAVLRHELAHSFVTARTGGNCPTWIQEGVAQWLEGGDPGRADASLASRARAGTLLPLVTLEAPFQNLVTSDVPLAYAESLSAIGHLLRTRGEAGLVRLLSALGDGLPSEEALPVAIGSSYAELQKSWEAQLKGS